MDRTKNVEPAKPLASKTRATILECYRQYGLAKVNAQAKKLILQCEREKLDYHIRSTIKGELAEVVLECHLAEIQKYIPMSVVSKGLCIRDVNTKRTTEMDVTFFTPCRIYMFECKSYSGKKTITNECTLTNATVSKDVYGQSLHHMQTLNRYLVPYRLNRDVKGVGPFKLALFELSTQECSDQREDIWKSRVPLLTIDNIQEFLVRELTASSKVNWDIQRMIPLLQQLDAQSSTLFKEHLKRLGGS